jgi:hypothetical protein
MDKFVKVSQNSKKFTEIGKRVQKGEIKFAFYGIDGNIGYHYYKVLK